MRLLILGSTGPTGLILCQQALARNHTLTLYTRSPFKLPSSLTSSPSVSVIQGELSDTELITSSVHSSDAVLSTIGSYPNQPSKTVLTELYTRMVGAMQTSPSNKRVIFTSPPNISNDMDGDKPWLSKFLAGPTYAKLRGWANVYADAESTATLFKATQGINWTMLRVPILINGCQNNEGKVHLGYYGDEEMTGTLRREDLARIMLYELENPKWVGKMPLLCSL